jgi:Fe-S cluster assembly iron-binding protein IscA
VKGMNLPLCIYLSEGREKHMLEVTARAREKLQEALLEEQTAVPQTTYRITPIPSMPNRLGIALDKEKRGDQVVKSKEGMKVLLVQSDLSQELEGMVLDYQVTTSGEGFTILQRSVSQACQEHTSWN